jgi:hypothetical protein
LLAALAWVCPLAAQEVATGSIRGTVADTSGARVAGAGVKASNEATLVERETVTDSAGAFAVSLLPPGNYSLSVSAPGMATQVRKGVRLEVGSALELEFTLSVAPTEESVTVTEAPSFVETRSSSVSEVVDARAIAELPLNGRRFSDLALLTPAAVEDPRGFTSSAVGDLAFGGVRGYHSSFLVDGADNNNAFFAQARGRYRAPYQFSNEVIQEFRVSSNAYEAELGRSGGGVINVVTKSGANQLRGSAFYYLRDYRFNARHPFVDFKPKDRQHQYGFTLGGRVQRNRVFWFAGFDQHRFDVPMVVRFADGSSVIVPKPHPQGIEPGDFEATDQTLVFAAADQLTQLVGEFRARLRGNAVFFKADATLSPRHHLTGRFTASRYSGENNVFLDPSSPVTNFAVSDNGEELVETEGGFVSLTSSLGYRLGSYLRVQFSRDLQRSVANSEEVRARVDELIEGFGRSSILPRQTRERRLQVVETLSLEGGRHAFKFGGDVNLLWIENYFPLLFGGQYIFDNIRVNPFTFAPQTFGLRLTPLRAYAHNVPRFYLQNFGQSITRPDTREYALFAQDSIRLTDRLAVNVGLRWDVQTFRTDRLVSNPLWPDSGKVPSDRNNFAPRVGFAYALGSRRPLVLRGGAGLFYTRIPSIYTSTVEIENGIARQHLFLDNSVFGDRPLMPTYPNPLVACGISATVCVAPASVTSRLETDISAFAADFRTPSVLQASASAEKEIFYRMAISASFLYTRGRHLIRARDLNLPEPVELVYPVFDDDGINFLDELYPVRSFSTWQLIASLTCPFPPCINPLTRPIPQVGAINVFESAATSEYRGFTLSARRRMTEGLYFRVAYTVGSAFDDGQDALVAGRPPLVQDTSNPGAERGRSVIDQRHRLAVSWIVAPRPFGRSQPALRAIFNDWRWSGLVTLGSGRPVNAIVSGDPNRDANSVNDRLPGARRNGFTGPDYATTSTRLARRFHLNERFRLDAMVESFNLFNRTNHRVDISDDGFSDSAARFFQTDILVGGVRYPAQYRRNSGFLRPTNAYAPRQVQLAVKLTF